MAWWQHAAPSGVDAVAAFGTVPLWQGGGITLRRGCGIDTHIRLHIGHREDVTATQWGVGRAPVTIGPLNDLAISSEGNGE